jgi:hypothetical protein
LLVSKGEIVGILCPIELIRSEAFCGRVGPEMGSQIMRLRHRDLSTLENASGEV